MHTLFFLEIFLSSKTNSTIGSRTEMGSLDKNVDCEILASGNSAENFVEINTRYVQLTETFTILID